MYEDGGLVDVNGTDLNTAVYFVHLTVMFFLVFSMRLRRNSFLLYVSDET